VVWRHEALGEWAEIWVQANDRDAVTKAVRSIDSQLSFDPASKGDVLREGFLQLIESPLRFL
jgi:hypothetical protein